MESVRQVTVLQKEQTLTGVLRKGAKKVPLNLFLRGKDIQFTLNGGAEGFHLRLKENDQEFWDINNGKAKRFLANKIGASIAGTDVTYEDLALKFLYWPNPQHAGKLKKSGSRIAGESTSLILRKLGATAKLAFGSRKSIGLLPEWSDTAQSQVAGH